MGARVAVAGASGYAGGELLRLISGHPGLDLVLATAGTHAGRPVTAVHPHLPELSGVVFAPTDAALVADARPDVVLVALPHGQSASLVGTLPPSVADAVVVDVGADFRLADAAAWQRFYGTPHAGTWTYGLPELPGAREEIRAARRVANPGCYVTTVTLALAPLLATGLVEAEDVVVVAASGTTGAGRSPKPHLMASAVMGSMSAYGVGGVHRHIPEIEQNLARAAGRPVTVSFTPTLAPMPRGILAVCTARTRPGADADTLRAALADAYRGEPFVHLLPDGVWPATGATVGSNSAHLQVAVDRRAGRVVVVSALDNLVKGAAGQALQNVNLMLRLDETAGLTAAGVAP